MKTYERRVGNAFRWMRDWQAVDPDVARSHHREAIDARIFTNKRKKVGQTCRVSTIGSAAVPRNWFDAYPNRSHSMRCWSRCGSVPEWPISSRRFVIEHGLDHVVPLKVGELIEMVQNVVAFELVRRLKRKIAAQYLHASSLISW